MKLRKEVKAIIIVIVAITTLVMMFKSYNKAVESCVEGGNDIQWCKANL